MYNMIELTTIFGAVFVLSVTVINFVFKRNAHLKIEEECLQQMQLLSEYQSAHPYRKQLHSFAESIGAPNWMTNFVDYEEPLTPACSCVDEAKKLENWSLGELAFMFATATGIALFYYGYYCCYGYKKSEARELSSFFEREARKEKPHDRKQDLEAPAARKTTYGSDFLPDFVKFDEAVLTKGTEKPKYEVEVVECVQENNTERLELVDAWDGRNSLRCLRKVKVDGTFFDGEEAKFWELLHSEDGISEILTCSEKEILFKRPPCGFKTLRCYLKKRKDIHSSCSHEALVKREDIGFYSAVKTLHAVGQKIRQIHAKGISINELRPENISANICGDDVKVHLDELPLARRFGTSVKMEGENHFDSDYIPPEVLRGEEVGPDTDVFSLGKLILDFFEHMKWECMEPDVRLRQLGKKAAREDRSKRVTLDYVMLELLRIRRRFLIKDVNDMAEKYMPTVQE